MLKETKIVKNFLKTLNLKKLSVRTHNGELEADILSGTIYISKNWLTDTDSEYLAWSKKHYEKLGYDIQISMRTFAILHELGHIISRKEYINSNMNRVYGQYFRAIDELMAKNLDAETQFYAYRQIKMERLADKYAYLIYKTFTSQVKAFDEIIKKM